MLLSGMNTVPKYIERKHFDKGFPENNNIKYTKQNKCKVLENNRWKERDIDLLSSKLMQENAKVMLLYCDDSEIKSSEAIQDEEIYDHVKNKLVVLYNQSDQGKCNNILHIIKELIKNATDEEDTYNLFFTAMKKSTLQEKFQKNQKPFLKIILENSNVLKSTMNKSKELNTLSNLMWNIINMKRVHCYTYFKKIKNVFKIYFRKQQWTQISWDMKTKSKNH